ncbi:MAG TPA: tetratricopeptide repeat protein [Pirellulales bacterium]|nr:tetratricopeptide repeat protein [Pirellulales bacterium]
MKKCDAVLVCTMVFGLAAFALADESADKLLNDSKVAARAGNLERAVKLASQAVEQQPDDARLRYYRGTLYEARRQHKEAVSDFTRSIELTPRDADADAYDHRGSERLALGEFDDAIADFDRAIALDPRREPGHWKRGIAYYYAGRYDDGRKQFEGYQTVDGNDVENAVWRFLCMARQDGVEAARRELLNIKHDRRVPMMEVYALFAGKAKPDDVVTAARAGDPTADDLLHRLFYTELYLALYAEATDDLAAVRPHLQAAVDRKIAHFMWDVARMHLDLIEQPRP